MRVRPQVLWMMALRGHKAHLGTPLPSKEDALERLRRLTGQDFGYNAKKWSEWLRVNQKDTYTPKQSGSAS